MESVGLFMNEPLAKLWNFMASYNCKSKVNFSDILKAFQECDEALSELEDQCGHWKIMYANACGDQDVLKESIRLLDKQNREQRETINELKERCGAERKSCKELENKLEMATKEYEHLRQLNIDIVAANNKTIDQLRKDNEKLGNTLQDLQKEHDELKKDCAYMTNSRDTWRTRAKHAEAEVEELKKKLDLVQHAYNGASKDRDSKAEAVVKLANKRDQLQEENDELKEKLNVKQDTIDLLTKSCAKAFDEGHAGGESYGYSHMYCDIIVEHTRLKDKVRNLEAYADYLKAERNTWRDRAEVSEKEVKDMKERLTEATDIPDIKEEYTMTVTMDNADYNDLMKLLWNKSFGASPEYMRTFLKKFCEDHNSCRVCPLKECGSDLGRGFDDMSDEEIEKYYKIAIMCYT